MLLKSVIPRLQWPKPSFKEKRAITIEEHAAIVLREQNVERREFYELLWYTGASQSDGACLRGGRHQLGSPDDMLYAQKNEIAWHQRKTCAISFQCRS
jgi:hypothetical protein